MVETNLKWKKRVPGRTLRDTKRHPVWQEAAYLITLSGEAFSFGVRKCKPKSHKAKRCSYIDIVWDSQALRCEGLSNYWTLLEIEGWTICASEGKSLRQYSPEVPLSLEDKCAIWNLGYGRGKDNMIHHTNVTVFSPTPAKSIPPEVWDRKQKSVRVDSTKLNIFHWLRAVFLWSEEGSHPAAWALFWDRVGELERTGGAIAK